ncbi:hypothetical protein VNO80_30209 [Phaseolus coccineus]|uniref:Uncharacterized protein n=1 Tax=Phaseolus coccineus TaxID=3886 RepID=A0AAN9LCV3_PHACN
MLIFHCTASLTKGFYGYQKEYQNTLVVDPPLEKDLEEFIHLESSEGKNKDEDVVDMQSIAETNGVCDNIARALKDLHKERYDDKSEVILRTSDLYYPSNNMDPYLKDQNDYDLEELEDTTIGPIDAVIVCALRL